MPFIYALTSSQLNALSLALLVGVVIAVIGHVTRSRTLILIGLLIIAVVSAYFGFGVAKVT